MRKTIFRKLEAQGLIANYNRFRKNLPSRLPKKVSIWDETLRESEQAPAIFLTYVEKVKLAKMMDDVGVSIINVGYPGFSEEAKNTIRRISNETFENARLAASARTTRSDIDACLACGIKEISISTPFNKLQLEYLMKTTGEAALKRTFDCIQYAKSHHLTVSLLLEDASRTPLTETLQILDIALKAGADRLVLADTIGFLRPLSTHYLLSHVRDSLLKSENREVPLSVRCSNDFGLATANTLAAIEEGAVYPQTSIAGFGERAGLAAMEEVVTALEILYNIDTDVDVKKLLRLGQLAEKSFALPIPFHKPIIGEDVFSHSSDRYIHGMLAHPLVYEPFPAKMIGRESMFYLGRQMQKELVKDRLTLAEIEADPREIDEIIRSVRTRQEGLDKGELLMTFYQIKKLQRETRRGLTDEDFWTIVAQVTGQKPKVMPDVREQP